MKTDHEDGARRRELIMPVRGELEMWVKSFAPCRRARAVLLAAATLLAPEGAAQQQESVLRLGVPIERALAGGEAHVYRVERTVEAPWRLAVEQRGIDVVVEVTELPGETVTAVDNPLDRDGTESFLGPAKAGTYRVLVRAEETAVGPGGYEIRLDELRQATAEDRLLLDAERALSEAGSLHFQSATRPEAAREAIEKYRLAAAHWRALGRRREEADAIHAMAVLTRRGQEPRPALALFRRAVAIWEALGDDGRLGSALNDMGLTYWELGELPQGRAHFERALALYRTLGDRYGEAITRNNQCLVSHAGGELRAALQCYRDVLELFQELRESKLEALVLNNIGYAYYSLGEPQSAIDHYQQALSARRAIGDRAGEAQTLNNVAVVYRSLGEMQAALAYYGRLREVLGPLGNRRREASALNNIGFAYLSLGDPERAEVYLQQALELRRQVEDRRGETTTLNNLGQLHHGRGELEEALAFHRQALLLAQSTADTRTEAMTRIYLGETLASAGDLPAAMEELEQAIGQLRDVGDRYHEARALHRSGRVYIASSEPRKALPRLRQALELQHEVGDRIGEAETLTALARAWRDLGDRLQARTHAEAAIGIVESVRSHVGSSGLRASFLGSRQEAYELLIDLLIDLDRAEPGRGWDRRALEVSERARARGLVDLVSESGAEIRRGVDPGLRDRRLALERRLNAKADRRLRGRDDPGSAEAADLELEIQTVLADLDTVEAEIQRRNPAYAALTRPPALTTAEIQELLDSDTMLLEYALGEERSFLWLVKPGSVAVFELPPRQEIEAAARRAYELLSAPDPGGGTRRREAAAELSRLVLGPVRAELGAGRLAIVTDGALHYVPFSALPIPPEDGSAPGTDSVPLVLRHEVVYLPSASVLAVQRRQLAGRTPAPSRALVLADPVFDPRDPRVSTGAPAPSPAAAGGVRREPALLRSVRQAGLSGFDRLPLTRQEALAITALAPGGEVSTALDFDANRSTVLNGGLGNYRVVHFATHGLINASQPELSGLVLSLVDEGGEPQEGFVRLRDVYNLELAADLVVLSGCRTALGKEIRGEGLLGLTRAFMYAGTPRVVASLWWVQDRATAELMTRFYRAMWHEGLRPAAALRKAQLSLRAERRFRDPFYWAAFVHQGDWR